MRQHLGAVVMAVLTATITLAFAPPMHASAAATDPRSENAVARAAVADLIGPHPWSVALPSDFAAGAGYQPIVERGLLVDPLGECSSPIQLPAEFKTACRAHDLGYDVLRYAERRHAPLGAWGRQAIDAVFQQRIHAACQVRSNTMSETGCEVMATIATTGVDLNSRRQNYATPEPEYMFGMRLSGKHIDAQLWHMGGPAALGVIAALVMATVLAVVWRRRVRRAVR
ncbi:hypothetical protein KO481_24945 [Nocardia sp. NEAU-G5]|uniref:Uncharacterized protein n=1 Tax=Nocardia albiluteola TaxID=2842303 RepID=A0ABS6B3R4_9NOCA|nr:hypothetical protein [Nocardia albiluteola]MBU3064763.1 hypothetical protein [Nocardia albiluteola]